MRALFYVSAEGRDCRGGDGGLQNEHRTRSSRASRLALPWPQLVTSLSFPTSAEGCRAHNILGHELWSAWFGQPSMPVTPSFIHSSFTLQAWCPSQVLGSATKPGNSKPGRDPTTR